MLRLILYPLSKGEHASERLVWEHVIRKPSTKWSRGVRRHVFLVAVGTGVAVETALEKSIAGGTAGTLGIALAFGLVLVVLVNVFGHVSGGHFNPAVTLSLAITGQFPWRTVPLYVVVRLAGAILPRPARHDGVRARSSMDRSP